MDETEAGEELAAATPIFNVYRRGYDPEQVDRYVTDQQRRLDEAIHRASESERKLAAAVGQLRELHRRVAVYESEVRNAQPPQLDSLGERVQRILQEAWEGAYNLRQDAEHEVNELRERANREVTELRERTEQETATLREQTSKDLEELRQVASKEAAEVVDEATRRALSVRDETERRRQTYLEQVERDRVRAIEQITYLYDQRQGAIAELARLQATVQATIEEMMKSPLGRPTPGTYDPAAERVTSDGAPDNGGGAETAAQSSDVAGDVTGESGADVDGSAEATGAPVTGAAVTGSTPGEAPASLGEPVAKDNLGEAASADNSVTAEGADSAATADASAEPDASGSPVTLAAPEDAGDAGGDPESANEPDAGEDRGPRAAAAPAWSEEEAPTVPMERFVLPRDREAARAAMRSGPGIKSEPDSTPSPSRSGGSSPVGRDETTTRSRPHRAGGLSPVAAADTTPMEAGAPAEAEADSAQPPVVRPKNGLFDVEQEGWS